MLGIKIYVKYNQNNERRSPFMSNWQTHIHFKLDFQKMDHHTGGNWLIQGNKHSKDDQLQGLLCRYPSRQDMCWTECRFNTMITYTTTQQVHEAYSYYCIL